MQTLQELRRAVDQAGHRSRPILAVGDNSFCNQTLFRAPWERLHLLARTRKDIRLCRRAEAEGRLFYAAEKFTPEQVRHNEALAWQTTRLFHGGEWRQVRFKQLAEVYWQGGARKRPLRLLVVAPIPYDSGKGKRQYYRDPAFLLTTALEADPNDLLQAYFDRWQIEVNHREIKDTLGVGQAQLRSRRSVPRQPALLVAAYSALLLAGIQVVGGHRSASFPALPKWRRKAHRPSCLDLITLLRDEITKQKAPLSTFFDAIDWQTLGKAAAA